LNTARAALPLAIVVAIAFLIYAWRLDFAPPYLHEAEVLFSLHAQAIATTAHDVYGRFMPLYFEMRPLGETTWWHPALVYVTALFLKVLPFSESMVRLPSVIVGLVDIVLMYFIAIRLFDRRWLAVLTAVLLALTPAHFIQSRIAMDYIYPVPFTLAWLLCLLVFLERRNPRMLFLATSFLGIGVYSYIASVVMMPVYLVCTWLVLMRTTTDRLRHCLIAAAGFAWPLIILPLWLAYHPQVVSQTVRRYAQPAAVPLSGSTQGLPLDAALEELRRAVRFGNVTGRISLYWYFFDPAYLFVTGGYASVMNSTRHVGVFVLPFLALVPVGVWHVATTERTVVAGLVVAGFLTAPFAALLVPEPYTIDREMTVVAFAVLLAAYGVASLFAARRGWMRTVVWVLLALVPLHFGYLMYDYFGDYRGRSAFWFEYNHRDALEEVIARSANDRDLPVYLSARSDPYIESYWQFSTIKHHREDLLTRTVYFDSETLDVASIPPGALVVMNRNDPALLPHVAAGRLRQLREIPEPAEAPYFRVLEKATPP
jgi:4-amino-4-deoxy-L-arabinose transferase-like glycosyltransferase